MDDERIGETDSADGSRPTDHAADHIERAITLLRTAVPVDAGPFDARVLSAIQQYATPRARPAMRGILPRMALSIGGATLAASIAVAAAIRISATEPALIRADAPPPAIMSVAPRGEQLVHFRLAGARAAKVTVAGSFNGWNTSATPLRRVGNATWVADVPLRAGRYVYQFVLDGHRWVQDPNAPRDPGDDFGKSNSVVTVVTATQNGS